MRIVVDTLSGTKELHKSWNIRPDMLRIVAKFGGFATIDAIAIRRPIFVKRGCVHQIAPPNASEAIYPASNSKTFLAKMKRIVPYLVAFYSMIVRWTCRLHVYDDPRAEMTTAGIPHVFAAFHAQQVAAMVSADPGTGAMVSRSDDGQIVVPALRANGHVPVRGSSGQADKGGASALKALIEFLGVGSPVILAVDGPRGPRGTVHKGIGVIARKSGAGVLPVLVVARQRIILKKAWDRMQIPLPFSRIDAYFAAPMYQNKGEKLDGFATRIQMEMQRLEEQHDPSEAKHCREIADQRAARKNKSSQASARRAA